MTTIRTQRREFGVLPFDPECIYAPSRGPDVRECVKYEHLPVLPADCRGCAAWEPPGELELAKE